MTDRRCSAGLHTREREREKEAPDTLTRRRADTPEVTAAITQRGLCDFAIGESDALEWS